MDFSWLAEVGPAAGVVLLLGLALGFGMLETRGSVTRQVGLYRQLIELERRRGDEYKATADAEKDARLAAERQRDVALDGLGRAGGAWEGIRREAERRGLGDAGEAVDGPASRA